MPPRLFRSIEELAAAVGEEVGVSDWLPVDQARIDAFADATGDHQWIHVDPDRAARGPFGATIAHGYLTLSLLPVLVSQVLRYDGWPALVNYGSNKVRFLQPVLVGSRLRARVAVADVRRVASGVQVSLRVTVELQAPDGAVAARPALIAEPITLLAG
ncbi:MAG TPA: MaoC family dehydratase [Nocardioidaceae bacterium]|nr:MaoC family dehydratase [Nocardioidaceae bacterium]